jgi:hypothetical protein
MLEQGSYQGGEWVEFVSDGFIAPDNIILAGMLGRVEDDPYGYMVCTPGISTMILPCGASQPYGYFDDWHRRIDKPDDERIARSVELWKSAFKLFEERHGWTGFVQIKGRFLTLERAWHELEQQVHRIFSLHTEGGNPKDLAGARKRACVLIRAYLRHPRGREILGFADWLKGIDLTPATLRELEARMRDLASWLNEVPRFQTQTEQINQAWRDGTIGIETEPFTGNPKDDV